MLATWYLLWFVRSSQDNLQAQNRSKCQYCKIIPSLNRVCLGLCSYRRKTKNNPFKKLKIALSKILHFQKVNFWLEKFLLFSEFHLLIFGDFGYEHWNNDKRSTTTKSSNEAWQIQMVNVCRQQQYHPAQLKWKTVESAWMSSFVCCTIQNIINFLHRKESNWRKMTQFSHVMNHIKWYYQ